MPKLYSAPNYQGVGVKGFVPEPSATAPLAPKTGQLWTDTSGAESLLKRWNGTRWETLGEILDGSITAAKLADGAVTTAKLAADSVTAAKLADGSVDTAALLDDAVTAAKLAAGAVDEAALQDDAVTEAKIADGAVTADKIAPGAVGAATIADGSLSGAKLTDGSVTLAKLGTDPLARANHTGTQAASTISDLQSVVQGYSLSDFADLTGDLVLGGNRITGLGAPQAGTDAATMDYVDASRAGFRGTKDPVRVVADPGFDTASPGATIDGVTMAAGDRFLVPDAGIYVFNGAGTAATADNTGVSDGTTVAVAEGSDAGYIYIQRADTDGGAAADWGVFQAGGLTYTAGTGLQLTGTQFSLPTVPVASGGTGATTAAGARAGLDAAGAYGETVPAADLPGGGAATTVTHNLGTIYVGLWATLDGSGQAVDVDWRVIDPNTVEITTDVALDDDLNVCVVGA
jgi:hypothetical protein